MAASREKSRCGESDYAYVLQFSADRACGDPFYEVYAAQSVAAVAYRASGGQCTAADDGQYVVAGDRVATDSLPEVGWVLVGTGRVRAYAAASPDGTPLLPPSSNPYDTELEANCFPHRFSDGATRCVTGILGNLIDLFSDPACTGALGVPISPECATGESARHYLYTSTEGTCGFTLLERLYEAVPYDGPLYRREGDACVATDAAPGSEYVATGDEVSPERFARL